MLGFLHYVTPRNFPLCGPEAPRCPRNWLTVYSGFAMKRILGIILLIVGIVLFVQGYQRKNSLAGEAAEAGTSIANSVDGGTRTPKHVGYMIAGGVLVVVGGWMALSRSTTVRTS